MREEENAMARTKACERKYIDRIIEIKLQIDELNREKREIGDKLGYGTWRSRNMLGFVVKVYLSSDGWKVSWKDVAKSLAKRLDMSDEQLAAATYGHRTRTYSHPGITVAKDKAKNPFMSKTAHLA
jgi:hypothetical protein